MAVMELKNIDFAYLKNSPVLTNINQKFEAGKMYAIIGHSGCGKTSLLSLLGGLDTQVSGEIYFEGKDILTEIGLERHRRENVSFIFQNYNLIDYMTPLENVSLTTKDDPMPYLKLVGLTEEQTKRSVLKLSGGEQQRVAIARALASSSKVILADEPTGNLDEKTALEITNILIDNAKKYNKCVIVVSHSNEVAAKADEVFLLKDGALTVYDINDK